MEELRKNVMEILENMVEEEKKINNVIIEILYHGCVSGIVPELIYHYQTEAFFIKHMDAIFELYNELKEECGELNFELSSNNLSWFAFEEMTRIIADEMEIEY